MDKLAAIFFCSIMVALICLPIYGIMLDSFGLLP